MQTVKPTSDRVEGRPHKSAHEIVESGDFKQLVARRWTVSMVLLALLFVTYYGYILLVANGKEFLSQRIGEVTTLGIPIGVGVIVFAFILTALYISWANKTYDPEVARLKGQLKQ